MENWEALIGLAVQVPLVLLVMWYSLTMARENRADSAARDKSWQEFLNNERVQRKEAMDHGLNSLKEITVSQEKMADSVSALARAVSDHDREATARYVKLIDELRAHKV